MPDDGMTATSRREQARREIVIDERSRAGH